jgi:glutamine synthetase
LWRGGENAFARDPGEDPRGLGLSELAYRFIGGLKANAKAYIAFTAPTVNSYKRLVVGAPASGATWAPAYISYGYNNRTQMLRVPAAGRIEDRTVDGSCNPYLAATAILAAGLDGVARELDPGEPNSANLYQLTQAERCAQGIELLPANLLDATRELQQNQALRTAFGKTPSGDYIDYYIDVKRREWQQAHQQITPWELDHYLQLF